jgi:hypothetical protein
MFSPEEARYLADHIPGANLQLLDGEDHFVSGNPAQILDAVEPFVSATPKPEHRRALAAIVFPAGRHAPAVVADLVAAGGRRRHTAAGDAVVLFDGPATAVRACLAVVADPRDVRIGLSVAEVAVDGGPVSGPGVDEAVRLGTASTPHRLLLTATAGILLSGSGIEVEPVDDPSTGGAVASTPSTTVPG